MILSFLPVVAAELVATAMSTGDVPGMPGSDRTPRSLNKKRRSNDRRFLLTQCLELDGANLVRLGTLRALGGLELHPLSLIQ